MDELGRERDTDYFRRTEQGVESPALHESEHYTHLKSIWSGYSSSPCHRSDDRSWHTVRLGRWVQAWARRRWLHITTLQGRRQQDRKTVVEPKVPFGQPTSPKYILVISNRGCPPAMDTDRYGEQNMRESETVKLQKYWRFTSRQVFPEKYTCTALALLGRRSHHEVLELQESNNWNAVQSHTWLRDNFLILGQSEAHWSALCVRIFCLRLFPKCSSWALYIKGSRHQLRHVAISPVLWCWIYSWARTTATHLGLFWKLKLGQVLLKLEVWMR